LDFVEMGEMASEGAKVLHTPSVEIAERYNVDVFVKNTFSGDIGTKVSKTAKNTEIVTGFIHRLDITDFFVDYTLVNNAPKRQRGLFKSLAEKHISLDLINICGKKVYFAVNSSDSEAVRQHLINTGMRFFERNKVAKISCIGAGMKGTAGVMANIVKKLNKADIKIYRSVDSLINISCIIDEDNLQKAMKILHELIR
ncbi:ACT domain-containing protein, partial [bacterium]|nr:ACT domain-containing protein [bacterium]